MSVGILGKKLGMTQLYDDKGVLHPVTVIQAGPCTVLQAKTMEKDKYVSFQLGFEDRKEKNAPAAVKGHCKKANSAPKAFIREFRAKPDEALKVGDQVTVKRFAVGQFVDVIAISKGKGFQGVVRRWRFAGGGASHGSKAHRRPGAIGNRTWPGRIWKNVGMPGHMGDVRITIQNLPVMQVREADNILLIRGSVPGTEDSYVVVRPSVKIKKTSAASAKKK
ncbi:MAG: 50S ribosomal protein L3 [Verrucomicrobiae bacterium]|nr:50S ribosomal protein L3 [Verrucomicrobiae bacterium]